MVIEPFAVIQYRAQKGLVQESLDEIIELCKQAVRRGAKIIVLPEMCLTGYIWIKRAEIEKLAETNSGPSFQILSDFAKMHRVWIAYGFAEKDGADLYNSQNLIDPQGGLAACYRKMHLFELDTFWATQGNTGFLTVASDFGRLGLGICMDLNYDDFIAFHVKSTDLLLFSTNWVWEGAPVHPYWDERLNTFPGTALMANSWGLDYSVRFSGKSAVYRSNAFAASAAMEGNGIIFPGDWVARA
jgi:predicted amidohydrolase